MNIKQLKYVCAIVESGSFSSAAAREGVSVQAVSKAMSELEGKLGTPLFERLSAGVRPTPFGRAFAGHARRVLDEWDDLERFARGDRGSAAAPYRMGFFCPEFQDAERFSALIGLVAGRALGRDVSVSVLEGTEALEGLRSGRVDGLVTIGPVREDDVTCGALGTVATCAIMAEDHPLAARESLTLADIAAYPVLMSRNFEHFNEAVLRAYVERGLRSRLVEVGTPEELRAFFAGRGVSFMAAGNLVPPGEGLVTRPVAKPEEVSVPICLSTLRASGAIDYVELRRALQSMDLFL